MVAIVCVDDSGGIILLLAPPGTEDELIAAGADQCVSADVAYKTVLSATYRPIESILIAGVIYLFITTVLSNIMERMETRLRYSEA